MLRVLTYQGFSVSQLGGIKSMGLSIFLNQGYGAITRTPSLWANIAPHQLKLELANI